MGHPRVADGAGRDPEHIPQSPATFWTPAALSTLRDSSAEQAGPAQQRQVEALRLEHRLADLVNRAYDLTPAEVALLWRTAPPHMPVGSDLL